MKVDIEDLLPASNFMTPQQFFAIMEKRKCSHCEKKATWIRDDGSTPSYCDEHFPYMEEKRREAANEWDEFQQMSKEDRIKKIRELRNLQ